MANAGPEGQAEFSIRGKEAIERGGKQGSQDSYFKILDNVPRYHRGVEAQSLGIFYAVLPTEKKGGEAKKSAQ